MALRWGVPHFQPHGVRVLWLLALVAMAAVGAAQMRRGISGLPPRQCAPDATSEAILATLTQERDVPARLATAMAALPDGAPVLILRPPHDVFTALAAYMVAYQAMPRPALIREATLSGSPAAVEELRRKFGAVVFVGQSPPPAFPRGTSYGRAFDFVPLARSP